MREATHQRSTPHHEAALRRRRGRHGNKTGHAKRCQQHDNHTSIHDERKALQTNAVNKGTSDKPTACGYDDGEPTQRAGHTPSPAQRNPLPTCRLRQDLDHNDSPQQAERTRAFTRSTQPCTRRLNDSPGRNSAGSNRKDPTTNKLTIRRLTQPCSNQTAAATTTRP